MIKFWLVYTRARLLRARAQVVWPAWKLMAWLLRPVESTKRTHNQL